MKSFKVGDRVAIDHVSGKLVTGKIVQIFEPGTMGQYECAVKYDDPAAMQMDCEAYALEDLQLLPEPTWESVRDAWLADGTIEETEDEGVYELAASREVCDDCRSFGPNHCNECDVMVLEKDPRRKCWLRIEWKRKGNTVWQGNDLDGLIKFVDLYGPTAAPAVKVPVVDQHSAAGDFHCMICNTACDEDSYAGAAQLCEKSYAVCTTCHNAMEYRAQAYAKRRLEAAAPKMLEALQAICAEREFEQVENGGARYWSPCNSDGWRLVESAIAEATEGC